MIALISFLVACRHEVPPAAAVPVAPDGRVRIVEGDSYLQYGVAVRIRASPDEVWGLLTDAAKYPTWNSTVVSIDGRIAEGEEISLVAKVAPDRPFGLTVHDVVANERMVWSDGNRAFQGVRTFTLADNADGTTTFEMKEALSGFLFPLISKKLPDFGPDFESFAADLKTTSEQASVATR